MFAKKQQPEEPSKEEHEAVKAKKEGRPHYDKKAYKRAVSKLRVHSRGLMRPPLQLWRLAGATGCLRLRG